MVTGPVLALEFRGVQENADFGFLTDLAVPGGLHRVDPLVDHLGAPCSLVSQAQRLAAGPPRPPRLVLAYCASAALGLHAAARAGAPVVLVDPDPVQDSYLRAEFAFLFRTLGEDPEDVLRQAAGLTGPALSRHLESSLAGAHGRLVSEYGADDEADELVTELLARYRAWLRFLCASAQTPPARPGGQVTVVTRKPLPPLARLLTGPAVPGIHRVPGGPGSTLDLPAVRQMIAAIVLGQDASRPGENVR